MDEIEAYLSQSFSNISSKNVKKVTVDSSVINKRDAACMVLGQLCQDRDMYLAYLDANSQIEKFNLSSIIHQMSRSPDDFWPMVESYHGITHDDIQRRLRGNMEDDVLKPLKTVQRTAWRAGTGLIFLGFDVNRFSDHISDSSVKEVFKASDKVISSMIAEKELFLANAAKKLVKTLPDRDIRHLKSDNDYISLAKEIVHNFSLGKMTYPIDISKFRLAKEPFIAMPTTLPPKDALAVTVVHLINELYSSSCIVAFLDNEMSHISEYKADSNSFILFSEDYDSAYALDTNPSLFYKSKEEGEWGWRRVERVVKSAIKHELVEKGLTGQLQTHRAELKKLYEKEYARRVVEEGLEFYDDKYLIPLPDSLKAIYQTKSHILKFFKRGYSTFEEVSSNPDFLHICKNSVAAGFGSDYYAVVLSDCQSVVLFPIQFWKMSVFYRKSSDKTALFLSSNGMKRIDDSDGTMTWYFSMFQLAHTFHMLECWRTGESYDYAKYSLSLLKSTVVSPHDSLCDMYDGIMANAEIRIQFVKKFYSYITGTISGAYIVPSTSKLGKKGAESIQSGTGYVKQVLDASFYDEAYDELDLFQGFDFELNSEISDSDDSDIGHNTVPVDQFNGDKGINDDVETGNSVPDPVSGSETSSTDDS